MRALVPPDRALRACVVVPARDEQELIGRCLEALAAQEGVAPDTYETILVLDACVDATEAAALDVAAAHPGFRLVRVPGPGAGAGAARRVGMDLACARLLALGRPDGLIACTDADSLPAPDWIATQLAAVGAGARAVGGRIELAPDDAAGLHPNVLVARDREARRRQQRVLDGEVPSADAEHWQFSAGSLAVTAATYAEVGGLEPLAALEDEAFERRLRRARVPILRSRDVRVTTSGRLQGRAHRGLSRDLATAEWFARRSFDAREYPVTRVLEAKHEHVSVVLPTREVAGTIGGILDVLIPLRAAGVIDELLVVDADSRDGTAQVAAARGVEVARESELVPDAGPALGKGDAMWRALSATTGEVVAYLDADTERFTPGFLLGLLGPLFEHGELALIKGAFSRPFRAAGAEAIAGGGGRVTELVARPLLNLHVPELAGFVQPLAGELAGRRDLLETLAYPVGYGVEIAMLIDALRARGLDALAQVDLGERQNRHQPLRELSKMAYAVLVAAERRIHGEATVAALAPGPLALPDGSRLELASVTVEERPPLADAAGGGYASPSASYSRR